jgi:hypothetical protein
VSRKQPNLILVRIETNDLFGDWNARLLPRMHVPEALGRRYQHLVRGRLEFTINSPYSELSRIVSWRNNTPPHDFRDR